jgi:RecA/RadA recombinase
MAASSATDATALAPAPKLFDLARVARGRELIRKDQRLSSGLAPLDRLLEGGLVRGRIAEIVAHGFGWMNIAAAFVAAVTRGGEAAAWIDPANAFDPASMAAAGVNLERVLWIAGDAASISTPRRYQSMSSLSTRRSWTPCKAAELVLSTCGFGLVVVDLSSHNYPLAQNAALRLARQAERSGTAVIVATPQRMGVTFAALSLAVTCIDTFFTRSAGDGPVTFEGFALAVTVTHNKLGPSRQRAVIEARATMPAPPACKL